MKEQCGTRGGTWGTRPYPTPSDPVGASCRPCGGAANLYTRAPVTATVFPTGGNAAQASALKRSALPRANEGISSAAVRTTPDYPTSPPPGLASRVAHRLTLSPASPARIAYAPASPPTLGPPAPPRPPGGPHQLPPDGGSQS